MRANEHSTRRIAGTLQHACVWTSWVGFSSSASASWCSRPRQASTRRAGKAPPTSCAWVAASHEPSRSPAGRSRRPCWSAACGCATERRRAVSPPRHGDRHVGRDVRQPRRGRRRRRVYGESELLDAIRRLPELRLKLPSLLSLDAARPTRRARALDVRHRRRPRAGARVRPHPRLAAAPSRVLRRHHFLVLTGPPEMGKTAIARMLGLALLAEGWEVHECTRPEQVDGALRARPRRSCSSPTTRSARPSTARTPPSAGRTTSTGSCAPPTSTTGSSGRRGPRRCAPGCGGCTASAAASASRSPAAVQVDAAALGAGGEDADPVPPRARRRPAARAARADPRLRRRDRRAPALHARADPPLRRARRRRVDRRRARAARADGGDGDVLRRARARAPRAAAGDARLAARPGRRARPRRGAAPHAARAALPEGAGRPRDRLDRPLPAGDRDEGRLGASELARPRDRVARRRRRRRGGTSCALRRRRRRGRALQLRAARGGERERPLLREDADWDALGDGLYTPAAPTLDEAEAIQLLQRARRRRRRRRGARAGRARAQAARLGGPGGQRRRDRRVGAGRGQPRPAPRAAGGGDDVARARAARTRPPTPEELERFADWLRLAELLQRARPRAAREASASRSATRRCSRRSRPTRRATSRCSSASCGSSRSPGSPCSTRRSPGEGGTSRSRRTRRGTSRRWIRRRRGTSSRSSGCYATSVGGRCIRWISIS